MPIIAAVFSIYEDSTTHLLQASIIIIKRICPDCSWMRFKHCLLDSWMPALVPHVFPFDLSAASVRQVPPYALLILACVARGCFMIATCQHHLLLHALDIDLRIGMVVCLPNDSFQEHRPGRFGLEG
jgi:hypothetical protein